jgi:hypothetical protein
MGWVRDIDGIKPRYNDELNIHESPVHHYAQNNSNTDEIK